MGTGPAIFDGLDGDWSAAGNWSGGTGASGVPAAGDDVIVRNALVDIASNHTAFVAIAIDSLTVLPSVKKSTTAAVTFASMSGTCTYGGGGAEFMIGSAGTIANAKIDPTGGKFVAFSGTWTLLTASAFEIDIGSAAIVTGAVNVGAQWSDELNATGYTTFKHSAGTTDSKRNVATLTVNQGQYLTQDTAAISTLAEIHNGGILILNSSGTVALFEAYAGSKVTVEGSKFNATWTNNTRHKGATIVDQGEGIVITQSNPPVYRGKYTSVAVAS